MWPLGNMDVRATTRPVVPSSQVEQIACRFAAMDPYAGTPAPRKLTGITPTSGLPLIGMSGKPGQPTGGAMTRLHSFVQLCRWDAHASLASVARVSSTCQRSTPRATSST